MTGEHLDIGADVIQASISPQHDYALVQLASEPVLLLLRLTSGNFALSSIADLMVSVDQVVYSRTGQSAILYSQRQQKIQVLTGMPGVPAIAKEFNVSALGGTVTALAISDNASTILAGISGDGAGRVFFLTSDGEIRLVYSGGGVSAITFLGNANKVVVADRDLKAIYLLTDVTGTVGTMLLGNEGDGIVDPIALEASRDNSKLFVANAGTGSIVILDVYIGRSPSVVRCQCSLSGFQRLEGNAVFQLMQSPEAPLRVFDGDSQDPRIVFLPEPRPIIAEDPSSPPPELENMPVDDSPSLFRVPSIRPTIIAPMTAQ